MSNSERCVEAAWAELSRQKDEASADLMGLLYIDREFGLIDGYIDMVKLVAVILAHSPDAQKAPPTPEGAGGAISR